MGRDKLSLSDEKKKRVWGTFSNFHHTEGKRECSSVFLPICKEGRMSGYTHSP